MGDVRQQTQEARRFGTHQRHGSFPLALSFPFRLLYSPEASSLENLTSLNKQKSNGRGEDHRGGLTRAHCLRESYHRETVRAPGASRGSARARRVRPPLARPALGTDVGLGLLDEDERRGADGGDEVPDRPLHLRLLGQTREAARRVPEVDLCLAPRRLAGGCNECASWVGSPRWATRRLERLVDAPPT